MSVQFYRRIELTTNHGFIVMLESWPSRKYRVYFTVHKNAVAFIDSVYVCRIS